MGNISFLLGAGFSVNQGYPVASKLNTQIVELKISDFGIADCGTVFDIINGNDYTLNYSHIRMFLLEFIEFYNSKYAPFNYEEFYDYYKRLQKEDIDDGSDGLIQNYIGESKEVDKHNLIMRTNSIFNQIIQRLISDGNVTRFYINNAHTARGIVNGYRGFMSIIDSFKKVSEINIHTLNHDLFLESLNSSEEFDGQMCNGFTEMGSSYYGESEFGNVRLEYFSDEYETDFRLFKLHGSFDQMPFILKGTLDNYIKFKYGINTVTLKKEIEDKGRYKYELDITNYSSDFLSGTTSKILRYNEDGYYRSMFDHYGENLTNCDKLIIIGYGCLDSGINKIIGEKLRAGTPIYVVDPYPSNNVKEFVAKKGATLVEKTPENITLEDFDEK
ncbi:hypothetical protein [Sphingobacterium faecium]|uniref:hypothetical protein n=1 Tax=Sphingobacterium faecium TaxID=34087 RepID=UPI00320B2C9F